MDLGVHPTVFVLPNVTTLNKINLLSLLFFSLKKKTIVVCLIGRFHGCLLGLQSPGSDLNNSHDKISRPI